MLADPGIRAQHARITTADSGLQIEPLPEATVAVNGHVINEPVSLHNGDWLALDSSILQIRIISNEGIAKPAYNPAVVEQKTSRRKPF
jgi:hypothetical protein